MKAIPIIAGSLYRVVIDGKSREVPAANGSAAIAEVLRGCA